MTILLIVLTPSPSPKESGAENGYSVLTMLTPPIFSRDALNASHSLVNLTLNPSPHERSELAQQRRGGAANGYSVVKITMTILLIVLSPNPSPKERGAWNGYSVAIVISIQTPECSCPPLLRQFAALVWRGAGGED
ncbi:hypothetical protein Q766_13455 [Flavobacterium subsaxonicum WB 4.1-42 = DSM 21790]|uniref:Uncharacterized protein n=1 Tax=Flavobacterium subsaxonicum WB 4.1-42 = DSM 21790 TaxID=1121898 RepID=A0A0A2MVF2_9FLAO|nr:hypothetical protein Q766_13455 [Flavobacterium subsaxonicum WB 4.1-42 = DSM 21790]